MPKIKSSAELDSEIEAMKKELAEKQKKAREARRREKAEAEQVRVYEEAQFNKEFVAKAREIRLSDYESDGRTVFELIESLIRPPVSPEPTKEDEDLDFIDLTGYDPTKRVSLTALMRKNSIL